MAIKYEINRDLLNKRIQKRYGTTNNFVKELGVSKQSWFYKIRVGSMSIKSMIDICNALDITENTFKDYFLKKVD